MYLMGGLDYVDSWAAAAGRRFEEHGVPHLSCDPSSLVGAVQGLRARYDGDSGCHHLAPPPTPFPPPPPAPGRASWGPSRASVPGTTGTPAATSSAFARTLSPMRSIVSALGPTKTRSLSAQMRTNSAF